MINYQQEYVNRLEALTVYSPYASDGKIYNQTIFMLNYLLQDFLLTTFAEKAKKEKELISSSSQTETKIDSKPTASDVTSSPLTFEDNL